MHGSKDTLVSPEQSAQLYDALRKSGDRADYVLVDGAKNGDYHWYQPVVINRVVDCSASRRASRKNKTVNQQQSLTQISDTLAPQLYSVFRTYGRLKVTIWSVSFTIKKIIR